MRFFLLFFLFFSSLCADYGYIAIEEPINNATYIYLKLALEKFEKQDVSFVLMKLNTPGGEVSAALKISDLLKNYTKPLVTLIENRALSAGALIAYSTPHIVAIDGQSLMGAATPVYISEGKMKEASAKVVSALRTEFANTALFHKREPLIAEAMVDKDLFIVKRKGLYQSVKEALPTDEIISTKRPLTLDYQDLMRYGVASYSIKSEKELFSLPFLETFKNEKREVFKDWRVGFFSFLTGPLIVSLLMIGLMVGGYFELTTPGFGLPGSIALFSLFFILLSTFSIQSVGILHWIFLGIGSLLLAAEIFIIPGFGVAGTFGILLLIVGLFLLILPVGPSVWTLSIDVVIQYATYFIASLLLSLATIVYFSFFKRPKFFDRLILKENSPNAPIKKLPKIGSRAVVSLECHPFGEIDVEGESFPAKSSSGFLKVGQIVKVKAYKNSTIIVAKDKNFRDT